MPDQACTRCGHVGPTATHTPGSIWLELLLWLCFLIPGLIYSLWRHSARHDACPVCGARELVPVNSPHGHRALAALPPSKRAAQRDIPPPSDTSIGLGRALGALFAKVTRRL